MEQPLSDFDPTIATAVLLKHSLRLQPLRLLWSDDEQPKPESSGGEKAPAPDGEYRT